MSRSMGILRCSTGHTAVPVRMGDALWRGGVYCSALHWAPQASAPCPCLYEKGGEGGRGLKGEGRGVWLGTPPPPGVPLWSPPKVGCFFEA